MKYVFEKTRAETEEDDEDDPKHPKELEEIIKLEKIVNQHHVDQTKFVKSTDEMIKVFKKCFNKQKE